MLRLCLNLSSNLTNFVAISHHCTLCSLSVFTTRCELWKSTHLISYLQKRRTVCNLFFLRLVSLLQETVSYKPNPWYFCTMVSFSNINTLRLKRKRFFRYFLTNSKKSIDRFSSRWMLSAGDDNTCLDLRLFPKSQNWLDTEMFGNK